MQMFSMLKREAARPSVPRSVPSHAGLLLRKKNELRFRFIPMLQHKVYNSGLAVAPFSQEIT